MKSTENIRIIIKNPDEEYYNLVINKKFNELYKFIAEESSSIIKIKSIIATCKNDNDFSKNLLNIINLTHNIRKFKLNEIENAKFYELQKKKWYDKIYFFAKR